MNNKKPYMVTTKHNGVFFGYTDEDIKADIVDIKLYNVRNCVYWSEDMKGVMGLAEQGPSPSCRIGPAVHDALIKDVTMVVTVGEQAAENWEKGYWG